MKRVVSFGLATYACSWPKIALAMQPCPDGQVTSAFWGVLLTSVLFVLSVAALVRLLEASKTTTAKFLAVAVFLLMCAGCFLFFRLCLTFSQCVDA